MGRDGVSGGDKQLSAQLKAIVDKLMALKSQEGDDDNSSEINENMEMLRCLLQQSEVLAKRVEKDRDNSWYKF